MTMVRTDGARSHAARSWSEPITLMSCIAWADIPGSGRRTIWLWTTVSTSVCGSSLVMTGFRMSASRYSVRSSFARGGLVSSPATYSISGSRSRRRATSVPR
jgi:hypothetical protein